MNSRNMGPAAPGRREFLAGIGSAAILLAGVCTPAAAEALPAAAQRRWAALSGSTFRDTLTGWATTEGWSVIWDLPVDYMIRASATFSGTFEEAVLSISDAIYDHHPEFLITVYRGNRVIHVRESTPSARN